MKSKVFLKVVAKIARKCAITACGTASGYGFYQPKEPAVLKEKKN